PKFRWLIAGAYARAGAQIFAGITGSSHPNGAGRVHATGNGPSPAFADIANANNGFSFPAPNQAGIVTGGQFRLWCTLNAVRISLPLVFGGGTGITVIDGSGGLRPTPYTAAQIGDAAHPVNTTDKTQGKVIYDATNNRLL